MSFSSRHLAKSLFWLPVVAAFVACSVPDYRFDDDSLPSHCLNQRRDAGETSIDCGGGECAACAVGQTCMRAADCVGGQCTQGFCQDVSCADKLKGNRETDIDCGGPSCRPCSSGASCTTSSDCASGICRSSICSEPTCDDATKNGDEVHVDCGGTCDGCPTGTTCNVNSDCASGACQNGLCAISCVEGKGECDGDASSECETNVKTSPLHCGGCGKPCNVPHAEPGCVGGTCTIESCLLPYDDCNKSPVDGCETNLSSDIENCVACGLSCSALNGTPTCSESGCQISCDPGFDDCNDDRSDGCERSTLNDVANCGGCENICAAAGAGETPYCKNGLCGSTLCGAGAGNCNGYPEDSCETNLLTDVENCGACGNACVVANGSAVCQNGKCAIRTCSPGFGNCDAGGVDLGYATGCETSTATSISHCGGCGTACSFANAAGSCEAGNCRVRSCTAPYQDCNGDGLDCETNINTNKLNCGGCGAQGIACDTLFAHSTGKCEAGACKRDVCAPNFGDCDANPANGCESDLRIDSNDCGQCNKPCRTLNASATRCADSVCQPTCIAGFAGCTDPSLGCSDSLDAPAHCGSCTTPCTASVGFCVSRACRAKLDVVLVNSNTVGAANDRLALSHTLLTGSGQYRLVLLAVASLGTTAAAARPDTVTYAGRAMRAYGTPPTYGTPSAFVSYYYLVDSELPPTAGAVAVVIDSTPDGQTARLEANLLEFKGVEQANPFESVASATTGGCGALASMPISVVTAGSFIYSLAAYEWGAPSNPLGGLIKTFDQDLNFGNLRGVGGYLPNLNPGSHSVGWSQTSCNNSAHRIVAIRPATTP